MLEKTPNQPSKLRTKNWVEINDNSCDTYNTGSEIRFKKWRLGKVVITTAQGPACGVSEIRYGEDL